MRIEAGKLVLEMRECWSCRGTLRVNEWVKCPACKGTGKKDPTKPKGLNCPTCKAQSSYARGQVLSMGTAECTSCIDGQQMETRYDYGGREMWVSLTFRVYRSNRHQTIGEYLLGHGCVYSSTDYGRHQKLTDAELIEKVREHTGAQTSTFTDKEFNVCSHIGIFCNDNGYSVKAVFGDAKQIENEFKRGLDVDTGFAVGERLAHEGLNGTMLVSEFKK